MLLSINRRINAKAFGMHKSAISLLLRDLLYLGTYLKILYRQETGAHFSGIFYMYFTAPALAVRESETKTNLAQRWLIGGD